MAKDQKKVNVRVFSIDNFVGNGGENGGCCSKEKWEGLCHE